MLEAYKYNFRKHIRIYVAAIAACVCFVSSGHTQSLPPELPEAGDTPVSETPEPQTEPVAAAAPKSKCDLVLTTDCSCTIKRNALEDLVIPKVRVSWTMTELLDPNALRDCKSYKDTYWPYAKNAPNVHVQIDFVFKEKVCQKGVPDLAIPEGATVECQEAADANRSTACQCFQESLCWTPKDSV